MAIPRIKQKDSKKKLTILAIIIKIDIVIDILISILLIFVYQMVLLSIQVDYHILSNSFSKSK